MGSILLCGVCEITDLESQAVPVLNGYQKMVPGSKSSQCKTDHIDHDEPIGL